MPAVRRIDRTSRADLMKKKRARDKLKSDAKKLDSEIKKMESDIKKEDSMAAKASKSKSTRRTKRA